MAEGILRHLAGDRFEVCSAGAAPACVRPEAVEALRETGIDIPLHRSKHVDEFKGQTFDYVLTVCDHARDVCPVYPGQGTRIHHNLEDPAAAPGGAEERLNAFRRVRDQITAYFQTADPFARR